MVISMLNVFDRFIGMVVYLYSAPNNALIDCSISYGGRGCFIHLPDCPEYVVVCPD